MRKAKLGKHHAAPGGKEWISAGAQDLGLSVSSSFDLRTQKSEKQINVSVHRFLI